MTEERLDALLALAKQDGENIRKLVRIAEIRERRLTEGDRDEEQ